MMYQYGETPRRKKRRGRKGTRWVEVPKDERARRWERLRDTVRRCASALGVQGQLFKRGHLQYFTRAVQTINKKARNRAKRMRRRERAA